MIEDYGNGDGLRELEALTAIVQALRSLEPEGRARVLASVVTLLNLPNPGGTRWAPPQDLASRQPSSTEPGTAAFSEDRTPSPKEFLNEKRPGTDVDRVACLAYYLTHYRDTPHFRTLEISKLNTEAAQLKFSNAAYAVDNATKAGLLVPASKGSKQLSAVGEMYVQALPDRSTAKSVMANARPRRTRKAPKSKSGNRVDE
jgi:hypothetical protein